MKINLSEIFSAELEQAISDTAPDDFPCGDLHSPWKEGVLHFLTARDGAGELLGVLAYQLNEAPHGLSMEIVGVNAKGAPLSLRMMFQAISTSADAKSASISCWIENDGMARIAERFGLHERARLFVKEVA